MGPHRADRADRSVGRGTGGCRSGQRSSPGNRRSDVRSPRGSEAANRGSNSDVWVLWESEAGNQGQNCGQCCRLLGPSPQEANKEEFEVSSMRCGRKLAKDGDYCWRWTGFNFGFDLLVTYTNRFIVFKRNTLSQPCGGSVSLQPRRNIAYRLRLASFDGSGKVICSRSTGYQVLALEKDQEYVVMNLDSRLLAFPLYIGCNFLYISPDSRRQESAEPESSSSNAS
ncbi:UNVERIFIED_CONTAM: hypothetical protein FKN15_019815 [Acipenser sinensis]